jgi:hypothetical protein
MSISKELVYVPCLGNERETVFNLRPDGLFGLFVETESLASKIMSLKIVNTHKHIQRVAQEEMSVF